MSRINIHRFIITMTTIAGIGLVIVSILEGWEYWVNPLILAGLVALWILHIGQHFTDRGREACYLAFAMFAALFHGVHASSFFDICPVMSLVLALFALYDSIRVLNLILMEYVFILGIQFLFVTSPLEVFSDRLTIIRLILQIMVVLSIYIICRITVKKHLEQNQTIRQRDEDIELYDQDMENFLSNISHELRTPVNVVSGMSQILLQKDRGKELQSIRDAGLRLANQIEDIQDYTEVRQDSLVLEEEEYMITSLISDVLAEQKRSGYPDDLELVIDLDPGVPAVMNGDARKIRKILRHLLGNAVKFTRQGGIYIRIYAMEKPYGVNLCMEVTDTGIGMKRSDIAMLGMGMYQANKQRNRMAGGIGLGLPVVYGMVHKMGGFIKIESTVGVGTTVRVTVPQTVADDSPCLAYSAETTVGDIVFHVRTGKYKVPAVRDFYRDMATNLAAGIYLPLYAADSAKDVKQLTEKLDITHIFMGEEEYEASKIYFDELSREGVIVAVIARPGYKTGGNSGAVVIPKPLYGLSVIKVLNGESLQEETLSAESSPKTAFTGVRALIVDDEPMNLVVATGMLQDEYGMITDTAGSGYEAIDRFRNEYYDIVFMDHMMPGMDGVEAMKHIREEAKNTGKNAVVVALTANAVSGAREMFLREGFDGFIAKPIDLKEFEHVMKQVLKGRAFR